MSVLIKAEDEKLALLWGTEISEKFVKLLFRDDQVSWRDQNFACSIECQIQESVGLQQVSVGVFPDFTAWLLRYNDDIQK